MADSLFDNRYRYDYIYPRGRSGETLRAVDTHSGNIAVVIKRPAPNDAPPIRAGQEVSILNERKALTRLAGHPVLTALMGGGQFFVGGMPHQYIVMERGTGQIVAEMVSERAAREERLPLLETLVIVDALLDLLAAAHAQEIVYNDVDAKHLFWDRDQYRLKVIDWGNAVFLEGDDVTPQGVSRQSDVYQVGELLYFILTGGGRAEVPRDAGEEWNADFRRDAERLSPRLQAIVSKALHPNPRIRYRTVADLRRDLTEYRQPFARERDQTVARINERLRRTLSKDELRGLLETLEPALDADPGNPAARAARDDIHNRLAELEIAAELDAARIYVESGNWGRAAALLSELAPRVPPESESGRLIALLRDLVGILEAVGAPAHDAVGEMLELVFARDLPRAAYTLLSRYHPTPNAPPLHFLLAERIAAHAPDVMLLRPNLYRVEQALSALKGKVAAEPKALLGEIQRALEKLSARTDGTPRMGDLRDGYRALVDQLTALQALCDALETEDFPYDAVERACDAAMALADHMHVIGRQATASPRDAMSALDAARAIDPLNPAWEGIARLLDSLYELLQSYQTYLPAADGSDLDAWLKESRRDLAPFVERLFDDLLVSMVEGLGTALRDWEVYAQSAIVGSRVNAVTALTQAADAVATISPTLSGWLNHLRTVVAGASYIERHALHGGLGRALADGWEAYDRGRLADAERLGQQAYEIAHGDAERFAAKRLHYLAAATHQWVDRGYVNSLKGSQSALSGVEGLFSEDENALRDSFAAQMPSKETYLRAFQKGIVEIYARGSTAAVRVYYFYAVLLGALDALEGGLDDAAFWREVGVRTMGEYGVRHPATRMLDEFIARRRDVATASALLNSLTNGTAMGQLESARKQLEESPQARLLAGAIQSVRELEMALRDWSDGEFRAAGIRLENAMNAVNEVEQTAATTLTAYRGWLMELQRAAAELYTVNRQMRQVLERRPAEPDPVVRVAHQKQADVTDALLGDRYAATLKQWRDTYEQFLGVYTDSTLRRTQRLNRFNDLFKAMFIDRHPAYPLYRHWFELTDRAPEFPAPPTDEPMPRLNDADDINPDDYRGRYSDEAPGEKLSLRERLARVPRWLWVVVPLVFIVGAVILIIQITTLCCTDPNAVLASQTVIATQQTTVGTRDGASAAATDEAPNNAASSSAQQTLTARAGSPVPTLDDFATPTVRPTAIVIASTDAPTDAPTATYTPSLTFTPSNTPTDTATYTPTATPTEAIPEGGIRGQRSLLDLFANLDEALFDPLQFVPESDEGRTYWSLGRGGDLAEGELIRIVTPEDVLETGYGGEAVTRIGRVEARLTLASWNPPLVLEDAVYFGMYFQDASDPNNIAGIQLELEQEGIFSYSQVTSEGVTGFNQRQVNLNTFEIGMERSTQNGAVVVFVNGGQVGPPIPFLEPDAPVLPVLYVHDGDVIVHVETYRITLR